MPGNKYLNTEPFLEAAARVLASPAGAMVSPVHLRCRLVLWLWPLHVCSMFDVLEWGRDADSRFALSDTVPLAGASCLRGALSDCPLVFWAAVLSPVHRVQRLHESSADVFF